MKLRLHEDSLRLRLSPAEVGELNCAGRVSHTTSFAGGNNLTYSIQSSVKVAEIRATFQSGEITVEVPQPMVAHWAAGDDVGISAKQPLENGRALKIMIEKDFYCLDPAINDPDTALYPNPKASH